MKQVDGAATNETQFCSGVILTFECSIPSSYSWEIGPLLNELILIGDQIKTVNGTSLSAQGQSDTRTSPLTLTTSISGMDMRLCAIKTLIEQVAYRLPLSRCGVSVCHFITSSNL